MAYLSDRLLAGVKRRIVLPASQPLYSNSDFFALADDTIKASLVPLIRSVNQDFFVIKTITALVQDQTYYAIPYRAIGRTLRDLKLKDPSGNRRDMALIALEDEHMYRAGTIAEGFYFYGDRVGIVPTPQDATYSLEMWWEMPPANLVLSSEAAVVASIGTTTVTVSSAPSTITSGSVVDFIGGKAGCETKGYDVTVSNVSSTTYTFNSASDIPDNLEVGDYISVAETSPVIQLPNEAYPYLETVLCMKILTSVGDFEGSARLEGAAAEEKKSLLSLLEPRIEGETTKIINRKGMLRAYRGRFLTTRYF